MITLEKSILLEGEPLTVMERIGDSKVQIIYLNPFFSGQNKLGPSQTSNVPFDHLVKVFQQSRRILSDTGSFFLFGLSEEHLQDLQRALRQIFGVDNFVAEFIIPKRLGGSSLLRNHESLICYRKSSKQFFNRKIIKRSAEELQMIFPFTDEKGRYRKQSLFTPASSRTQFQWNGTTPPGNASWKFSLDKLESLKNEGLIEFHGISPSLKTYASENDSYKELSTVWSDIEAGVNKLDNKPITAQPLKLLERIVRMASNEGDWVLDPFCGAGSMLVAAANLNRKFIGVASSKELISIVDERLNKAEAVYDVTSQEFIKIAPIVWDEYYDIGNTEEDKITEILLQGESNTVEFKESAFWNYYASKKDPDLFSNVGKAVTAFANSFEGGTLLIGIKNNKSQVDLELDFIAANAQKKDEDGYSLCLNSKLKDTCGPSIIGCYSIKYLHYNEKKICLIKVKPSKVPVFFNGDFFVRNDNQSIKLSSTADFYAYLKIRF